MDGFKLPSRLKSCVHIQLADKLSAGKVNGQATVIIYVIECGFGKYRFDAGELRGRALNFQRGT
jgi:hypothetical protein